MADILKTHASFFTGIRGFDEAAEKMGWVNVLHCEINNRLRRFSELLNPFATSYGDIKQSDFIIWRHRVFCVSGGFPCQPFSVAGEQLGTDDERHLWPEMLRAIREIQPPWVVGENVRGLVNWSGGLVFEQVQADLEAEGYEVLPFLLPAAGVDAPHERYRVWFIAYSHNARTKYSGEFKKSFCNASNPECQRTGKLCESCAAQRACSGNELFRKCSTVYSNERNAANSSGSRRSQSNSAQKPSQSGHLTRSDFEERTNWRKFPTQSPICNGDDGLRAETLRAVVRNNSDGVLTEKEIDQIVSKAITTGNSEIIRGGGNAIVPQVAEQIFRAIEQYDALLKPF